MPEHRADCQDCPWSYTGGDVVDVSDRLERHARKEQHDVVFERAVATDGGEISEAAWHCRTDATRDTGPTMERVSFRLPQGLLDAVDGAVRRGQFPNRSEALREAVREQFVRADGGATYINPTGEGYLGIWSATGYTLTIAIGAFARYDWHSNDDLWAADAPVGIRLTRGEEPAAAIAAAEAHQYSSGRGVTVPAEAVRAIEGLGAGGDVRGYARGDDILLVASTNDPTVNGGDRRDGVSGPAMSPACDGGDGDAE